MSRSRDNRLEALERSVAEIGSTVQELAARAEIYDVLARYCRGADRCDAAAMRSCFFDDAIDEHGFFEGSAVEFAKIAARSLRAQFVSTKHYLCNVEVALAGDVARAESYVLALMRASEEGLTDTSFLARYLDRFERRDGTWRIAHRILVSDGTRIDAVTAQAARLDQAAPGARGAADPSNAWREALLSTDHAIPMTIGDD